VTGLPGTKRGTLGALVGEVEVTVVSPSCPYWLFPQAKTAVRVGSPVVALKSPDSGWEGKPIP
jgi:hypothetical protein